MGAKIFRSVYFMFGGSMTNIMVVSFAISVKNISQVISEITIVSQNVRYLDSYTLVLFSSVNYAKANSDIIDDIYVSTDDDEIKRIAISNNVTVIDRPEDISGDNEPTITTVQHVLDEIKQEVDNIFLLQPTNPLRPKHLLQEAFGLFLDKQLNSLFTVTMDDKKLGKIKNDRYHPFNYSIGQRSQDLEQLYFENGLLYITKAEMIRRGHIISNDAFPYVVNHIFSKIDIDTYEDFEYAEYLLHKHKDI